MTKRIKINCKECGGDIGDVVHDFDLGRAKQCRNCGHRVKMRPRRPSKKAKAEADIARRLIAEYECRAA